MGLKAEHIKALALPENPQGGSRDLSLIASQLAFGQFDPQHQLPIDEAQFLAGGFNPSVPAAPSALDPATQGTVIPRRWQYPVGYNLPSGPGSTKLVDFKTLRNLADVYDVLRRCLEIRKEEIAEIGWEITSREPGDTPDKDDLKVLTAFFERPDPIRGWYWDDWIKAALEEVFVVDALSVYPHQTWGRGKGALGSDLFALEVLAGDTIKPLVDIRGARPMPPNPAYQQFLYGIPRTELAADVQAAQQGQPRALADTAQNAIQARFTASELYYRPYHPRAWTLYGFSNVEQIIININLALKRQQWHTSYFTDGAIPALILHAPEEWDARQIREYEEGWNSLLASDMGWKQRAKVAPGLKGVDLLKPALDVHDMSFDEWLARVTCLGCDVMPGEIGLEPKGVIGGAGQVEGEERATYRKSLRPVLSWLRVLLNEVLRVWFQRPDLQFRFVFGEAENRLQRAQEDQLLIDAGVKTQDEARIERGLDPYPEGLGARPVLITRQGPIRLEDVDAISKAAAGLAPDGSAKPVPNGPQGPAAHVADATPSGTDAAIQTESVEEPALAKSATADLKRWEAKALKAVREKRSAAVRFDSTAIPAEIAASIQAELAGAMTPAAVKAAFAEHRLLQEA